MDAKEISRKSGELAAMSEKRGSNGGEVVIPISGEETPKAMTVTDITKETKSVPVSCPSPEISGFSSSPNKPPKIPTRATTNDTTLTRKRTLTRSVNSKPKSRFGEQPISRDRFEEKTLTLQEQMGSFSKASPNNKSMNSFRTNSITPRTPDFEEIYKKVNLELNNKKQRKFKIKVLVKWFPFACILGCLVASLTVDQLVKSMIWGVQIWKWCVLVMVTFCGLLITNKFMHVIVFLIEKNFLLRKKVLYFVHGLKKNVQVFIWLCLVLLTWVLLFKHGVKRSETPTKILNYITLSLVSLLIGALLFLIKTLLLKILASNFHVNKFFDRIQESVFHQYILLTLSGDPLPIGAERLVKLTSTRHFSFGSKKKGKEKEKKVIDMGKLHKMKQEKVPLWTMKTWVDAIMTSGLTTISNTLDETFDDGGGEQTDKEITNEEEAMAAAYHIFMNVIASRDEVAQRDSKFIDEADLLRFMIKEEVDLVFPLFEVNENKQIDKNALADWVVKIYNSRKQLAHALNDTKTGVKQLNKLLSGILIVVTFILGLLLMEIATTKVLVLLSSQLVVAAFIFGNTCKTIFEAVIFVFVMHPFDVGDRCVVDGVQLLVEEMNILNTVFLKLDNEKVYYPNSVLATKPISNYYRSPDMGDTVEFSIGFTTPVEKIGLLKEKIKKHLMNHQHWHPNHNVVVKEIENVNKLKMALYCNHTINFQDFPEKNRRRTELVIEIKKMFEELNIKYILLSQEVQLGHLGSESTCVTDK